MNENNTQRAALTLCITAVSLALSIAVLSVSAKTDIASLLQDFRSAEFLPNKNTITLKTESNINFLYVFYSALAVSSLILAVFRGRSKSFAAEMKTQVVLIVGILLFVQGIQHAAYSRGEFVKYWGKSIEEKINYNFKNSYAYAQYCKSHLKGKHLCRPITDADLDPQKNLLTYLAVRYYLYPLDIVTYKANSNFDCAVIFLKKNPKDHIPDMFTGMPLFDSTSLIAVKDGILR